MLTCTAFDESGWEAALRGRSQDGYDAMKVAFSQAAQEAMKEGRHVHARILTLLADICSMMLSPGSVNEPFKPFIEMHGRRSPIPDDLSETDIAFLAEVVDAVDDAWLKARLADMVWVRQVKRDVRFALMAIDAYRSLPLDVESLLNGSQECWERAIRLAQMLRDVGGNRVAEMETVILDAIASAGKDDRFLCLWLTEVLAKNGLGRKHTAVPAQKLADLGAVFEAENDLSKARKYFSAAADWFKRARDEDKWVAMTVAEAEVVAKEAASMTSSGNATQMAAAFLYEDAIKTYRTIPGPARSLHRVDERIAELRALLASSSQQSLAEMHVVSSGTCDLGDMAHHARQQVCGKDPMEALRVLCNIHAGTDVKEARARALEQMRAHPLQFLVETAILSHDGRVIARRPGLTLQEGSPDEEIVLRAEMVRWHGIMVALAVRGCILPALEQLLLEHRFREADFVALASRAPIVPKSRSQLFGKALFAGYDGDFVSAIHLLTPQIEHVVRCHLKGSGATTTTLDANGVENEVGLSTLLGFPETDQIFGANVGFELRALFTDAYGPNLRNELAHGLLDDDACESIYAVYAWWFGLRLVFNTFWNASQGSDRNVKRESGQ